MHGFSDRVMILAFALAVSVLLGRVIGLKPLFFLDVPERALSKAMNALIVKLNKPGRAPSVLAARGLIVAILLALACYAVVAMMLIAVRMVHELWLVLGVEVLALAMLLPFHHIAQVLRLGDEALISLEKIERWRAALVEYGIKDTAKLDIHGLYRTNIEVAAVLLGARVITVGVVYLAGGLAVTCAWLAVAEMWHVLRMRGMAQDAFAAKLKLVVGMMNTVMDRLAGVVLVVAALFAPTANAANALRHATQEGPRLRAFTMPYTVAAFAGAVDVTLGGALSLAGVPYEQPWVDGKTAKLQRTDLLRAQWLMRATVLVLCIMVLGLWLLCSHSN